MSWASTIQAATPFEAEEICVNPMVAEGWGLKESCSVSCSMLQNVSPLKSVNITLNEEDYQMAECSAERIQTTLLDQVGIVGHYQSIVIWLSASISVRAVVGKTKVLHRVFFVFAMRGILKLNSEPASSLFYF